MSSTFLLPSHYLGYLLSSLTFDTLVTLLIVYRVFHLREAEGQFSRSPLVQLFVSEELGYFLLVSILNLANGFVFAKQEKSLQATAVPFTNMLPPILACRLILGLHEHGSAEGNALLTTGKGNVGFIPPEFLYRSKPGPTPARLSTIRFQNPDRLHPANPEVSANPVGVGEKTSFAKGLTSIRDAGEDVDSRDVLVSPAKPDGDEAASGADNQV